MWGQVLASLFPALLKGVMGGGGSGAQAASPSRTTPGQIITPPVRKPITFQPAALTPPPLTGGAGSQIPPPAVEPAVVPTLPLPPPPDVTPAEVAAQVVRHPYPGITVTGEGRIDNSLAKPPTRPLGTSTPDPSLDGWYRPLVGTPTAATPAKVKGDPQVEAYLEQSKLGMDLDKVAPSAPAAEDWTSEQAKQWNNWNAPESVKAATAAIVPFPERPGLDVAGANADRTAAAAKEYRVASRPTADRAGTMGPGKSSGGSSSPVSGLSEGGVDDVMGSLGAALLANMFRKKPLPDAPEVRHQPLPDIWEPPPRPGIGWGAA